MRTCSDIEVGDRREADPRLVTEREIVAFARQFDPQPMHLGEAETTIASGWHTASVTMDAMVECWLGSVAVDVGLGVDELRWPSPVRPGDRLTTTVEVIETSDHDDERGRVALDVTTTVEDRIVLSMIGHVLVQRSA